METSRRSRDFYRVVRFGKSPTPRQLKLKRFFALNDPQVPGLKEACLRLMGPQGWTLREGTSGPTVKGLRQILSIQKVFADAETAHAVGRELASIFAPRPRPQGNAAARTWHVTAPGGQQYTVTNLLHWCRQNEKLFLGCDTPGQLTQSGLQLADRVYAGLRDPRQRFWKGWTAVKISPEVQRPTALSREALEEEIFRLAKELRFHHHAGQDFAKFQTHGAEYCFRLDFRLQKISLKIEPVPFHEHQNPEGE
jgi:hypothetical protein